MFEKKSELPQDTPLPRHIAIIMDGNGRWAKKRFLPRKAGHQAGGQTFRKIARYCNQIGIGYLTVYAFSTENWKRPQDEIDALMKLFHDYLEEALRDFADETIVTRFIGDRSVLSQDLQQLMARAEEATKEKPGMVLNIAINYGGRMEILHAAKEIARKCADGTLDPQALTEADLEHHLYTAGQPDPDLIIRPSGEQRISNFLLWQSAYSEFLFDNILWPDFKPEHIDQAIAVFAKRNRRFGGVVEEETAK